MTNFSRFDLLCRITVVVYFLFYSKARISDFAEEKQIFAVKNGVKQ